MPSFRDLTGHQYGRLKVIRFHEKRDKRSYYLCKCECGTERVVRSDGLTTGHTQSCGCLCKEINKNNPNHVVHGKSRTRLYGVWSGMKERCNRESSPAYVNYGGRGIKLCEDWENNFSSFYDWANKNGYEEDLTIERVDNNKGYSPENCTWITKGEQNKNKRSKRLITIGKETKSLAEWCECTGLHRSTIHRRYKRGLRGFDLIKKQGGN